MQNSEEFLKNVWYESYDSGNIKLLLCTWNNLDLSLIILLNLQFYIHNSCLWIVCILNLITIHNWVYQTLWLTKYWSSYAWDRAIWSICWIYWNIDLLKQLNLNFFVKITFSFQNWKTQTPTFITGHRAKRA